MNPSNESPPAPRDSYLGWALATDFRYLPGRPAEGGARSVGLLIRWKSTKDAVTGREIAERHGVFVPRIYAGNKKIEPREIWSVLVPTDKIAAFVQDAGPHAERFELATPLGTAADKARGARILMKLKGKVLAGVLDDGCAFANSRLMSGGKPRVVWLWNQDPEAPGYALDDLSGPSPACAFGYGAQWAGQDLQDILQQENQSQERAYAAAGLAGLRRAAAHGPHVTDLLCGGEDWPIVFVQFPPDAINDPSGVWLHQYAVDGLNYIVECAGKATETIVVNLSWGPQTGPHDGMSVLEAEIDRLVKQVEAQGKKLIVSLAAGNSYSARAHAQFAYGQGASLQWIVPPDGQAPQFLEIWWPNGVNPADAKVTIKPPAGQATPVPLGESPNGAWHTSLGTAGASAMALLVVSPTEHSDPQQRGAHGAWTITFPPGQVTAAKDIHVYVARATQNMGARRRAKVSYLTDVKLEESRFVAADKRFDEAPGSAIRREGTLSGIATGELSLVATGYEYKDKRAAPYSSAGPTRGGARTNPDNACVTDRSAVVAGLRATGVRSGTTIRLVGTSMAAPQLARQIAKDAKAVLPGPNPDPPKRIGNGLVKPDDGLLGKQ